MRGIVALLALVIVAGASCDKAPSPKEQEVAPRPTTLRGAAPRQSGVDTVRKGDTLSLTFWRLGRIDDSTVIIKPTPRLAGIPFGAYSTPTPIPAPLSLDVGGTSPGEILGRIASARARGAHLILNLTGGAHTNYTSKCVFVMGKWQERLSQYYTPGIRAGVAAGVKDGTITGFFVMDEPFQGIKPGNEAKCWGPNGLPGGKATVDSLCGQVKAYFPSVAVGVVHDHRSFEPEKNYGVCDFILSQYRLSKGPVRDFRDGLVAFGKRSKIAVIPAFNALHGGTPSSTCPKYGDDNEAGTLCPPTPSQVKEWGMTLGAVGCALASWRWEDELWTDPSYVAAFKAVADSLGKLPRKDCRRTA